MSRKRVKKEYLDRTDHLLDMSPIGRSIFISRDKQAQNRTVRRLKCGMRLVIILVIVGIAAAVCLVGAFYLIPWFRSELTVGTGTFSSAPEGEVSGTSMPVECDELGLPVYGDEVSLFVVNSAEPADEGLALATEEFSGIAVDQRIVPALRALVAQAKADGLSLAFTQGYTSYQEQEKRFNDRVLSLMESEGLTTVMARTEAKTTEPAPGESDFQSGLCLRLSGDPETFQSSKTYTWLKKNMGKYGFIFRYPEYKEDKTGLTADPTVIRYVGAKHAAAMQQRSLCLEEYLDYLASQG